MPSERPIPSLKELAALIDISPRHLRRAFKESTGLSIGEQIGNNRLQAASTLLCETQSPIKEIAWRLGFSDQYSFTVAFKRRTGETPSTFRRRLQRGERLTPASEHDTPSNMVLDIGAQMRRRNQQIK